MHHSLLIAAQFVLAAMLVFTTRWRPIPWVELLVCTPGIGLAVWAWAVVGWRDIRIQPSTTDKTRLIQTGPYALVRHPMYTGLLWFTASLLPAGFTGWRVLLWVALLVVLILKIREEEREMQSRFDGYTAYQDRVGGLVPKRLAARIPGGSGNRQDCRVTRIRPGDLVSAMSAPGSHRRFFVRHKFAVFTMCSLGFINKSPDSIYRLTRNSLMNHAAHFSNPCTPIERLL